MDAGNYPCAAICAELFIGGGWAEIWSARPMGLILVLE